jgi:hypothetical protein
VPSNAQAASINVHVLNGKNRRTLRLISSRTSYNLCS